MECGATVKLGIWTMDIVDGAFCIGLNLKSVVNRESMVHKQKSHWAIECRATVSPTRMIFFNFLIGSRRIAEINVNIHCRWASWLSCPPFRLPLCPLLPYATAAAHLGSCSIYKYSMIQKHEVYIYFIVHIIA